MSAVITRRLVDLSRALESAPRKEKTALCQSAAQELGLSLATIYRRLGDLKVNKPHRKKRIDAGSSQLTEQEAETICTVIIESARRNDKRLYSLEDAVQVARSSGLITAGRVDTETGEFTPMSISAIRRAMINYRRHPDILLAPAPVTELVSHHPNHVWQIDASLCVLYYLTPNAKTHSGLRVMDADKFYKNKPRNLARITANRVWSYEITDHYTGWIYVQYVMGAESSENLCNVFINAMQERGGADMLHGVPEILMMDPGSANTSEITKNLCRSLGIRMIVHAPGAARVTGQVENARNIIERKFEAGLKFQPVADLDELNALAGKWRANYNATAIHRRYKKSRSALWMTIREEQLIKAPAIDVCRSLAVSEPVTRKVTTKLRVSFEGSEFSVAMVPSVCVGDTLMITRNPWRDDSVQVHTINSEGQEVFYIAPVVVKNEAGFDIDGAAIGEEHKRHAETPAQKARKQSARLAMGESTDDAVETARKEKRIPFNGELQPYKHIDDTQLPEYLPRRGTEHDLTTPTIETPPIGVFAIASRLQPMFPDWSPEHYAWLSKHHPAGVKEEELQTIAEQLRAAFERRPSLAIVKGA
ncbi:MAG: transposase family protein [Aestuariibacter sp.]|nr:transposase family protein [Aestuariibacter sp.]